MYAVIMTGGKQYRVSEGDVVEVEKLDGEIGTKVLMPVLMTAEDVTNKAGVKAEAEIVGHGKGKKIVVFKYKAKKNERKKMGHRQSFTRIKIVRIG